MLTLLPSDRREAPSITTDSPPFRPVVTTETVGAATLVRNAEAGVVVPPGDADALANGIAHVLGNLSLYEDQARAFAPRVAHELSPRAIALQIARHLSEIVP